MAHKKPEQDIDISYPDQRIEPVNMAREVRQSFIEYSMSVIVSRALPDARDGMKPGQRRILYAMYEDHLTYDQKFRKSATTVGNVLGRYHPHGDVAVYGTMVRMAQDFSYRYPLVEGQGNFGNIDGDGAAAYRYTEARLSKLSNEMMRDIDKETVPWDPNFDNTRKEPAVLPARFPNLLVNGAVGIAVGMATNIPTHNLGEVIDGTLYFMDHPDAGVTELMQFIKGPDFPTGAGIYGTAGILEAYSTGKGRIMVRAKAEVEEEKHRIIITEIPYMVQKSDLVKAMADQVKDKKIEGVTDIRDESGKDGMRIVVECRRDANCQVILNQFYKYTQLQDTCAVNMLALVNGEPKILSLRQILKVYVDHQISVITGRVNFDLAKALREEHLNEGYKIAIDHIDEVISIIRSSPDTSAARENLRVRFSLSEEQAQAIVNMTLGRLSGMERQKVEDRLAELREAIAGYRAILADPEKIRQIIREEMTEIKEKFSDPRRTTISEAENEIILEDLIERHNAVITLTHGGYIKRQPSDTYSAQRRGGKGVIGMATKEEDYIERVAVADSHSHILFFTSSGRCQAMKAYRIPEAGRTAKGNHVANLLELEEGEKITSMLSVKGLDGEADLTGQHLVMVTRFGTIKRTALSEFVMQRKGGKIAISLDEGDELVFVAHTWAATDIMIATREGQAIRFRSDTVREMGRTARGVRGIQLREGDMVVGACIVPDDEEWLANHHLLTITEKGYGKRTEASHYGTKGRGGMGMIAHNLTDKTGKLVNIAMVGGDEDILLITDDGTMIRTPADGISVMGRSASGVIVMRTGDAVIANFAVTEKEEEDTEEADTEAVDVADDTAEAVEVEAVLDTDENDTGDGTEE
ncbi:MAG: DNA gyrase subunit A [Clostridia bacterium]|nr:DNA gyrase subunit A [Clostridia bacterium]